MAEVNANSLPAKTDLGTNDSAIVVDQTTNAGALVDLDVLADKVLDRITSKTFANQVGGSSAATLLAQLSTLNSKFAGQVLNPTVNNGYFVVTPPSGFTYTNSVFVIQPLYDSGVSKYIFTAQTQNGQWNVYVRDGNGDKPTDGTVVRVCILYAKYV